VGDQSGAKRRKKIFWSCPSTFLALKVQLFVLVSAFVHDCQYGLVSLYLFYSRCPSPCPAICKSGRRIPLVPYGIGATDAVSGGSKNFEFDTGCGILRLSNTKVTNGFLGSFGCYKIGYVRELCFKVQSPLDGV